MKKMTEAEVLAMAEQAGFDESFLDDPDLMSKVQNDDLPKGVQLSEHVGVTVFSTPKGPRIYLSGNVDDPDRVSFLLDTAHLVALQNAADFYLGLDQDDDDDEDRDRYYANFTPEGQPVADEEALEKAADEAGHMVVKDGYVGGGAMTAGDIV